MTYKIVAGPTQMTIKRCGYRSELIDIGNEYISGNNQKAKDYYFEHMHPKCQEYIRLKWTIKCIKWNKLKEQVKELVDEFPNMYFDGPSWIMSTVPWKQAKYGEWFIAGNRARWLLKKEYTNGIRNRREEASDMPTV